MGNYKIGRMDCSCRFIGVVSSCRFIGVVVKYKIKKMAKGIKNTRLKKYDYKTDGYYFITICSNNRKNFTKQEKQIISEYIKNIKNVEINAQVDYYQLARNHLHMILVLENSQKILGELIRRFKARVSTHLGKKLWQPNYYEHIIRTEKALEQIREYIRNNPSKEQIDFGEIYEQQKSP